MLRKIDCVIIRVEDVEAAAQCHAGGRWPAPPVARRRSVGLGLPETDAEIGLHSDADMPSRVEVHYLVDSVAAAVEAFCQADPFGTRLCILDLSKGPRALHPAA